MGLPGTGKTFLSEQLVRILVKNDKTVTWFNADIVRQRYNDWDFSEDGRIRQSIRMKEIADTASTDFVICDFVCPLPVMRDNFKADWTIWVDTLQESRYADTNKLFVKPDIYDIRVIEQDADKWAEIIVQSILNNS